MKTHSIKDNFLKIKTNITSSAKEKYRRIKRAFTKMRGIKTNTFLSILAVLISSITMYFQFFNVKHELLYSFLSPKIEDDIYTLVIPIVYKNNGNQNEMILGSNIEMEVKLPQSEKNYFRRIGDTDNDLFPIILAPGEMKTINLKGDYEEYFKGMLEVHEYGVKYRKIDSINNLSIKLTTSFLRNKGIENVERNIGKISFRNIDEYDRFDYEAITLMELKPNNNTNIVSNSIINAGFNDSFSIRDSLSSDQIEYVKFLINQVDHPEIVAKLKELLDNNNVEY